MIANFFNTTKPFNTLVVFVILALIYSVSSIYSIDVNLDFILFSKGVVFFYSFALYIFYGKFYRKKKWTFKRQFLCSDFNGSFFWNVSFIINKLFVNNNQRNIIIGI